MTGPILKVSTYDSTYTLHTQKVRSMSHNLSLAHILTKSGWSESRDNGALQRDTETW